MRAREGNLEVKLLRNQAVVADRCVVAASFFARLRGLIGRARFVPGEAMLFPRCNDIHMWFMRVPIDVVFLAHAEPGPGGAPAGEIRAARYYRVASLRKDLKPWRPLPVRDGAASETLELPAGTIARLALVPGDQLCIS